MCAFVPAGRTIICRLAPASVHSGSQHTVRRCQVGGVRAWDPGIPSSCTLSSPCPWDWLSRLDRLQTRMRRIRAGFLAPRCACHVYLGSISTPKRKKISTFGHSCNNLIILAQKPLKGKLPGYLLRTVPLPHPVPLSIFPTLLHHHTCQYLKILYSCIIHHSRSPMQVEACALLLHHSAPGEC